MQSGKSLNQVLEDAAKLQKETYKLLDSLQQKPQSEEDLHQYRLWQKHQEMAKKDKKEVKEEGLELTDISKLPPFSI